MRFIQALALCTSLGCATAEQVKVLQQKVDQLEMEIAQLQQQPKILIQGEAIEGEINVPAGTGGDEETAKKLIKEIDSMMKSGKSAEAVKAFAELKKQHGGTVAYKKAGAKLEAQVKNMGKTVSNAAMQPNIEKWYVDGELDLDSGLTFLVFWEVWCPHCKKHMPLLNDTYNKLSGKGLKVVGLTRLSKGVSEDKVTSYIAENDLQYPIAKDKGAIAEYFGVRGIPSAALVKDGKIVWSGHPAKITDQDLQGWL